MANILIVDDEEKIRHLLSLMLERRGHKVTQAGDGIQALSLLKDSACDMVITDIKMPRMDGLTLLNKVKEQQLSCPVVFITAFATVETAVDAMRLGAVDYITKPFEEDRIVLTVERTLNLSRIIAENRDLRQELQQVTGSDEIIYVSEAMTAVMDLASRVAQTDSAVLINGESGTGKEVLAKYIHSSSSRQARRFVPVNCAAISPQLVESELFGHEKGSFTGADRKAVGKFEFAAAGTLFLDEIGDLPLEAQAKLLRALQEKKIQRVGGNEEIAVDVRVICATNRNLSDLVERGDFRQDLFFRVNVFPIHTPPLRERMDDVAPLTRYFLKRIPRGSELKITDGGIRCLMEYDWPGNVRELANAIERSVILAHDKGEISADTLSFLRKPPVAGNDCVPGLRLPTQGLSIEELENELVKQALEISKNNQTAAARLLGLSRAKFRVLLKQTLK